MFPSVHIFITLAVDFIKNYSKFYKYISRKLIAFTPMNEIDLFKKLIFDRDKDKNYKSESFGFVSALGKNLKTKYHSGG